MKQSQLKGFLQKQPRQSKSNSFGITQTFTPRQHISSQQNMILPNRLGTLSTAFSKEQRLQTEGNEQTEKQKEIQRQLEEKCIILDKLITTLTINLPSDSKTILEKIESLLMQIVSTFQNTVKNEIELGILNREHQQFQSFNKLITRQAIHLTDKNKSLSKEIDISNYRSNKLMQENQKQINKLNEQQRINESNIKKIGTLEKRIEFLLSNDINIYDIKSNLTGLLKENEQLKRDLERKNQEIDRMNGKMTQYQLIISRLQKTIESLKKQTDEEEDIKGFIRKDDVELLMNYKIPQNLDFRIVSQKLEHQNLLNEICGDGNYLQIKGLLNNENQKSQFQYIIHQLLSYKNFSERLNQVLLVIEIFSKCSNLQDLIINVNRQLPSIFKCEQSKLWLLETKDGLLYSYSETQQQIKALFDKGCIADTFKRYQAQNLYHPNKPIIYRVNEDKQYDTAKTALLLPIFCQGQDILRGTLIILNSQNGQQFSFDDEYYGILIGTFLSSFIQKLIDQQSWLIAQKYRQLMNESITHIFKSENKQQIQQRICKSFNQIFGIKMIQFYFVENEQLVDYNKNNKYTINYGLAGMAVRMKQRYIINDVKNSKDFNPFVDILSILPLFIQPLYDKQNNVIGVIEKENSQQNQINYFLEWKNHQLNNYKFMLI